MTVRKGYCGTSPKVLVLFNAVKRKGVLILRHISCRMSCYVTSGQLAYSGNSLLNLVMPSPCPFLDLLPGGSAVKHCVCSLNSFRHLRVTVVQNIVSLPVIFCFSCKENAVLLFT